jgi:hypothetical protein
MLERLLYGGKFNSSPAQMDRCWRWFNAIFLSGAGLLLILMRSGARTAAIWLFFALVAFVSVAQSSWKMGSTRRILIWWIAVIAVSITLVFLFRSMDFRRPL